MYATGPSALPHRCQVQRQASGADRAFVKDGELRDDIVRMLAVGDGRSLVRLGDLKQLRVPPPGPGPPLRAHPSPQPHRTAPPPTARPRPGPIYVSEARRGPRA